MRDIKVLKDKHKDKRAFIIGTGPSLNKIDVSLMKNDVTIGCNMIGRKFTPDYLCISDRFNVYYKYKHEIDSYPSKYKIFNSGKHSKYPLKNIPKDAFQVGVGESNPEKIYLSFEEDLKKTYSGNTVIIDLCIPLAYYMGIRKIYLVGCDCTLGHFYTKWTAKKRFYMFIGCLRNLLSLEYKYFEKSLKTQYIPTNSRAWDEINRHYRHNYNIYYVKIKEALDKKNCKIFNASSGGVLDVFEKVDYDSLF